MSDDLTPQDISEFFAGLDSFLEGFNALGALDEGCPNADTCGVHYRNDYREGEGGNAVRISYVGKNALYSYVAVDFTGYPVVRTEFYTVGENAIGENLRPSLATEKPGSDVDKIHEDYIGVLKNGKTL